MNTVHSLIDAIIALPIVAAEQAGTVVGARLILDRETPYGRFYKGVGSGRLQKASLMLSKTDSGWNVRLDFNIDNPYFEHELELHRYGAAPDIVGVYPEAQPEGEIALGCKHAGFALFFEFTSTTRRLVSLSIGRPKPPTTNAG